MQGWRGDESQRCLGLPALPGRPGRMQPQQHWQPAEQPHSWCWLWLLAWQEAVAGEADLAGPMWLPGWAERE